jgi:hypothetical protein
MKIYNGEKAIISLTSWKARINTVGKTLYSLLKMCPGFHIVLVLSEEEFPKKEEELPEELMLFVDNDLIEILWVYKNYKAFKKVLFTMDKYRDVPVISADDDCIYIINYAQELYDIWLNNKDSFITYRITKQKYDCIETWGFATLHPPFAYGEYGLFYIDYLEIKNNKHSQDDNYYTVLRKKVNNMNVINLNKKMRDIVFTHDEDNSLYEVRKKINNTHEFDEYIKLMQL